MRRWRICAVVGSTLIVAMTGCSTGGSEAVAATTTATGVSEVQAWAYEHAAKFSKLGATMGRAGEAASDGDTDMLTIACVDFGSVVEEFRSALPSPDPELTKHLRSAMGNFSEAATECGASALMGGQFGFGEASRYLTAGIEDMDKAYALLRRHGFDT